ncbi:hypothetical protein GCM10015536_13330 [Streptomyces griseomycini]|nr:hypothetical protein GCM10015536_13330 [Streptomyces griseomycini]
MAVVTEGGLAASARAGLIVRSALSTSVRAPERERGTGLFERTGRRVVLTEAGRALPAGAQPAREAVAAVAGPHTGRVDAGTVRTLACVGLPGEPASSTGSSPGPRLPCGTPRWTSRPGPCGRASRIRRVPRRTRGSCRKGWRCTRPGTRSWC